MGESVTNVLSELKWVTLHSRREEQDMRFLVRILREICQIAAYGLLCKAHYKGRHDHSMKFELFKCRTDYYLYSYFPRVVRQWNKLSEESVVNLINGTSSGVLQLGAQTQE